MTFLKSILYWDEKGESMYHVVYKDGPVTLLYDVIGEFEKAKKSAKDLAASGVANVQVLDHEGKVVWDQATGVNFVTFGEAK